MRKAKVKQKEKAIDNHWLHIGFIFLLSIGLYSNTLDHGYVLDDVSVISDNRYVMQGLDGIGDIWSTSYRAGYWNDSGTLYRPLTLSVFALQWELSPNNSGFAHLCNVLLYALLSVLIYQLIRRLTTQVRWALISTLLFVVCTVHTEVVANIKSLDEILSLSLGVVAWLALLQWIDHRKLQHLIIASLSFTAGMFIKEGLIAFVAVIPLGIWFFRTIDWKALLKPVIALVVPVFIYLAARASVLGGITASLTPSSIDNPMIGYSFLERWLTGAKLLALYVFKLFYAQPLRYEYAYNTIEKGGITDPLSWLGILITGALIYAIIKGWKDRAWYAFTSICFLATIALYTNTVILIGAMFAERFLFFASFAWALALGALMLKLKSNLQLGLLAGALVIYGSQVYARNPDWKSSYSLYAADMDDLENSCKAHYNLGLEIMKEKAMKTNNMAQRKQLLLEAKKEFEKALEIKPGYHLPKPQIALVYYRLGDNEEAVRRFNEALGQNPNDDSSWNNLAGALVSLKRYEDALGCYKKAVELNPYYTDALGNAGAVNGMLGRHQEAISYLERAIKLAPNNASYHQYLGLSHQALGNQGVANRYFQQANRLKQ